MVMNGYKLIAMHGPSPNALKQKISRFAIPEIIKYADTTYKLPFDQLRNIGLDHHDDIVGLCVDKGLVNPALFSAACQYCENSNYDLIALSLSVDGPVMINDLSKLEWRCRFVGDEKIKVATPFFDNKKKFHFYAIADNCAFTDSLIEYLVLNGTLMHS